MRIAWPASAGSARERGAGVAGAGRARSRAARSFGLDCSAGFHEGWWRMVVTSMKSLAESMVSSGSLVAFTVTLVAPR